MVAEFLREKIHSGSRLSVVSAYFTIYAYEALSAMEREMDQQVYALYGLTPEEIAIVEGAAK